jgi:hypothetical protein
MHRCVLFPELLLTTAKAMLHMLPGADHYVLSIAAVCLGGYGSYSAATSPTCAPCAADTYGPKGSVAACTQCADSGVSAAKSDGAGDCYAAWQNLQKDFDFLPVSAGLMTAGSGATEGECKTSCDTTTGCAFYQFDSAAASSKCSHHIAPAGDGTVEVGFKIDTGVYSVIKGTTASSDIGEAIRSPTTDSIRTCQQECDKVEGCVVVVVTKAASGFVCSMKQGALSADIKSQYKVSGAGIGAWTLV